MVALGKFVYVRSMYVQYANLHRSRAVEEGKGREGLWNVNIASQSSLYLVFSVDHNPPFYEVR